MADREYRRVANQPRTACTAAEYEQLRRALLMIVAQFRAADPEGCYNLEVRVVLRDRTKISV